MNPKPIVLTQSDTNPEVYDPQPMVVVGSLPAGAVDLTSLPGYDAGETQTLKNVTGTLTWVTDTP